MNLSKQKLESVNKMIPKLKGGCGLAGMADIVGDRFNFRKDIRVLIYASIVEKESLTSLANTV